MNAMCFAAAFIAVAADCPWPPPICGAPSSWTSVVRLESQGVAGLLDRLSTLVHAGNLAASVCAKLWLGPPCELLTTDRKDRKLQCRNEGWAHYATVSYAMDRGATASPLALDSSELQSTRLVSELSSDVVRDYGEARRLATRGESFEWVIRSKYQEWKRDAQAAVDAEGGGVAVTSHRRRHPNVSRCEYVDVESSAEATALAEWFARSERLSKAAYATLHVRRGDDAGGSTRTQRRTNQSSVCNTELPEVHSATPRGLSFDSGDLVRGVLVAWHRTDRGIVVAPFEHQL